MQMKLTTMTTTTTTTRFNDRLPGGTGTPLPPQFSSTTRSGRDILRTVCSSCLPGNSIKEQQVKFRHPKF